MIFSNFFRVKPKDVVFFQSETKRCCFRQDVQAADMVFGTLLQSEAAECGPSCLEAGFGKLASKVDLPQGAGSREAPWRA